jgi:hypothetical protein
MAGMADDAVATDFSDEAFAAGAFRSAPGGGTADEGAASVSMGVSGAVAAISGAAAGALSVFAVAFGGAGGGVQLNPARAGLAMPMIAAAPAIRQSL